MELLKLRPPKSPQKWMRAMTLSGKKYTKRQTAASTPTVEGTKSVALQVVVCFVPQSASSSTTRHQPQSTQPRYTEHHLFTHHNRNFKRNPIYHQFSKKSNFKLNIPIFLKWRFKNHFTCATKTL